jgi:excisionase family DNA binding protein
MADQFEPLTLTPTHAARLVGVGKTKMLALIREGRIAAKLLDGRYRIASADVKTFCDGLPVYTPGKAVRS